MAGKINYTVYDVTIIHPAEKAFIRQNVVATNDTRAFMKVLANNSKWNKLDVDEIEYKVKGKQNFIIKFFKKISKNLNYKIEDDINKTKLVYEIHDNAEKFDKKTEESFKFLQIFTAII